MAAVISWWADAEVDPAEVGHKAASLAAMAAAGLAVPTGFVVTAEAFRRSGEGMSTEVRDVIVAAYARLGRPSVAVRSSATAEDLADASFAGQYDSILGVQGDGAVVDAVAAVWRSLFSDRAVAYRRARGIGEDGLAMAVVVQELVYADAAGVLFTRHPLTGDDDVVVVSAARGMGEGVVAGTAATDTYTIGAGDGAVVEAEQAGPNRVLDAGALAALADLGRRVRAVFGDHRDVEFAIRDGVVLALQARPITALELVDDFPVRWVDPADAARSWTLRSSAPLHALEVDIQAALFDRMREGFAITGSPMMQLNRWQVVNGFVYVSRSDVPDEEIVARQRRLADRHEQHADRGTSLFEVEVEPVLVQRLAELRSLRGRQQTLAGRVELLERSIAAYADAMGNLHWQIQMQGIADWPARFAELTGRPEDEAGILLQALDTRTSRLIRMLQRLARIVQSDAALVDIFERRDWNRLDDPPLDGEAVTRLREGMASLLREHGLRTGMGMGGVATFTSPTWRMAPSIPLGVIASYVRQDLDERRRLDRRLRDRRRRLEAGIRRDLAGDPVRLEQFELARKRMANAARTTEDHNHLMEQATGGSMREAALLVGAHLVASGRLADPDDVFHLSVAELRQLAAGVGPADVAALVRERHAVRDRQAAMRPPRALGVKDERPNQMARMFAPPEGAGFDGQVLRGLAVSRGRATGPARLAPPDHAPPDVRPGDVLVAGLVGEAWTPIFPLLGGLVLDFGGIFQHAAVVAREYGIPAVMMTKEATTVIADGQSVTVDGDTGIVELH